MMKSLSLVVALAIAAGIAMLAPGEGVAEDASPPLVRVAYFVPRDREPCAGYEERLDRVMTEVQRFYRDGMDAAGYGPKTFRLERDADHGLRMHLVRGAQASEVYGRNASGAVRSEVKAALARQGIDVDRQTLVIFEVLLKWEGDRAIEVGPYVGGGNHLRGTAWVYDDERLDPRLLGSKEPGGYYHRSCSLGKFNSHYIGGVAHELGHALGLPHCCQRRADRERGTALMGAGNHTYGQELRNEGRGTFLTKTSAMRLVDSRPFAGPPPRADARPRAELVSMTAEAAGGDLVLSGRLRAEPPARGIAAYNDPESPGGDYDAVGWTCDVEADGGFRLVVGELRPGGYELRLLVCHSNGAASRFVYQYAVDEQGRPETDVFGYAHLLAAAVKAYTRGDRRRAESLSEELLREFPDAAEVQQKASHLRRLLDAPKPVSLTGLPGSEKAVLLSRVEFVEATVGWYRPLRDQVLGEIPGQCFLQVGGRFHESGLYAHAPSRYVFDLGGQWKRLRAGFGLQDGHNGSVVFVVRAAGNEVFRSPTIRDHRLRRLELDMSGVERLELVVENASDGAASDWGVWIEPTLER